MKKVLTALLLALSMPSFAQQLELTATIDFSKPETLNPPIIFDDDMHYINAEANVFNKVFTSGAISMSFSKAVQTGGGAYEHLTLWDEATNTGDFFLRITQGTDVTFSVANGGSITSIELDNLSTRGGLALGYQQPGSFVGLKWTAGSSNVSSVTFNNSSTPSKLKTFTIKYTAQQNVLTPTASISDGAEFTTFSSMNLTFSESVTAVNTSGITISGTGISGSLPLVVSVSGRVVTLSLPAGQVLNTDGDYTINIPAGCFRTSEGYMNKALSYSFKVREPQNTFNVLEVDPASGSKMSELVFPIVLTFPNEETNYIGHLDTDKIFYLRRTGATDPIAQVKAVLDEQNPGKVLLQVQGTVSTFKTNGTYTLTVDRQTVYNQMYGTEYARYNNAINLTYTVEDPLKDLKNEATSLKGQIGSKLGYPAVGSEAAEKLAAVTAEEADPTKEELEAAIAAFYAETNVVMPVEGQWYSVVGVNSVDTKVYLAYDGDKISLTKSADKAAAFLVSKVEDSYIFKTADGKFLMTLNSGDGVTENNKAKKLTLAKLLIEGVDNKSLLGKFSIYGWLGRDADDNELPNSYSTIDYTQTKVAETPVDAPCFGTAKSSAFLLLDATDPTYVAPVNPSMTLTPTSILLGNVTNLTLTFSNVDVVGLKDASKAYFSSDAAGANKVSSATLTKKGDNAFSVSISGLAAGTYYLQLPVGTFDYSQNGNPVNDIAFIQQIKITEPQTDFKAEYSPYVVLQVLERNGQFIDKISDVDLNDLVIMAEVPYLFTDLIPDPKVTVNITNYSNGTVVGEGHFEAYSSFKNDYPNYASQGYKAIKLVMDKPVKAGDLQYSPDVYCYIIPEAAFGDANFGKYLAGTSGIKKENCIVNPKTSAPYFYVDNDAAASGIRQLDAEEQNGRNGIYDLTGRRVNDTKRAGVYIINGKKIMVK